jgi:MFS family permease
MKAQTLHLTATDTSGERALVAAVALGAMLAPLNSTMIAVALPRLTAELGADTVAASWLVTAYLIIMAALQPVAGKLGDRLGRRWLMLGGIAGFGLASLGAASAASLPALIALPARRSAGCWWARRAGGRSSTPTWRSSSRRCSSAGALFRRARRGTLAGGSTCWARRCSRRC